MVRGTTLRNPVISPFFRAASNRWHIVEICDRLVLCLVDASDSSFARRVGTKREGRRLNFGIGELEAIFELALADNGLVLPKKGRSFGLTAQPI